jgi:hypothetical protein
MSSRILLAAAAIQASLSSITESRVIVHEDSIPTTSYDLKSWAGKEIPVLRTRDDLFAEKPYGKKARRRNRGGKY